MSVLSNNFSNDFESLFREAMRLDSSLGNELARSVPQPKVNYVVGKQENSIQIGGVWITPIDEKE